MTSNQIAYQTLLESKRANQAKELENFRSNSAREAETRRANVASESIAAKREAHDYELGQKNIEHKWYDTNKRSYDNLVKSSFNLLGKFIP